MPTKFGTENGETLDGTNADDVLIGLGGDDILNGLDGPDVLNGGSGEDQLNGGTGVDAASYELATAGVRAELLAPGDNLGEAVGDSYSSIENLIGSEHADNLEGTNAANTITGRNGSDRLNGLGGNDVLNGSDGIDVLIGGTGGDQLNGGTGSDTASYATATSGVRALLHNSGGNLGDAAGDTFNSIEHLIGSEHGDRLEGNDLDNQIRGRAGGDLLFGLNGDDILDGDSGDDQLSGGIGEDTLRGGSGNDELHSRQELDNSPTFIAANLDDTDDNERGALIDGGSGDDIITVSHDFHGTMTIDGNTGAVDPLEHDLLRFGGDQFAHNNPANVINRVDLQAEDGTSPFGSAMVVRDIDDVHGSDRYKDVFRGNDAANALRGFGNNDRFEGRGGADTLDGGTGFDVAEYLSSLGVNVDLTRATQIGADAQGDVLIGIEQVEGSLFADTLRGTSTGNILFGNSGSDRLEGRAGGDRLEGGTGSDSASYESSSAAVTVTLNNGGGAALVSGGHAAGDVFISIENLVGSAFSDTLTGNSQANTIDGSGGVPDQADRLFGLDGADVLRGGLGGDELTGGAGNDRLNGGFDPDFLDGSDGSDTADYSFAARGIQLHLGNGGADGKADADPSALLGNPFEDILRSIENVIGSNFNDTIFGNELANGLAGLNGDDYFGGDLGADAINGGNGFDTVDYNTSPNAITIALDGTAGTGGFAAGDTLSTMEGVGGSQFADAITGNFGANTLTGFGGTDILRGGFGNDRLLGGDGNDTLEGGAGADELSGGTGSNTAIYVSAATGVRADLTTPSTNTGEAAGDTYNLIDELTGSQFTDVLVGDAARNELRGQGGNDQLFGNGEDDLIFGGVGQDVLRGGDGDDGLIGDEGNDTLEGGLGSDRLTGEDGTDTATYASAAAGVTADLTSSLLNPLNTGEAAGDTYDAVERLIGSNFVDSLRGDDDSNRLDGSGGADTLVGRAGSDQYMIDNASDQVVEAAAEGIADSVFVFVSYALSAGIEIEVLAAFQPLGTSSINLTGNGLGQTVRGNDGVNTLDGAGGSDRMQAFGGDDTYFVDNAGDTVTETANDGSDRAIVALGMIYTLEAGSHVELLRTLGSSSTYGVNLHGNELVNTVQGNNAANVLSGGLGNDTLSGFGAADVFRFNTALGAANVDRVTDFNVADDTIQISDGVFAGVVEGTLAANAFHIGPAATAASHRIVYNSTTGALFHDADGSGATAAVQFATLATGLALTNQDFVVI